MQWTPTTGAARLVDDVPDILGVLCKILIGDISSRELAADPGMLPILQGIGGRTALALLRDPTGKRLAYWPRVWAARTLALIGDSRCASALLIATSDQHWRVRMQAARAAGLVSDSTTIDRIAELLSSDSQRRVREAVALSIGRGGSKDCLVYLAELTRDDEPTVRRAADRAIIRLQARLDRDKRGIP